MRTVTTLSDADIRDAIAAWMTIKLNRVIRQDQVNITTEKKMVGHQMNQSIIHLPVIRIEES